jgi:hypothetical protein
VHPSAERRPNLIVAGVHKCGTTSVFNTLAASPEIAASSVKEVNHFIPVRFGDPAPSLQSYEDFYGPSAGAARYRLEASPGYFCGGAPVAEAVDEALPGCRVIVLLREPRERLVSFFRFMQSILTVPATMTLDEYVERCGEVMGSSVGRLAKEPYTGVHDGHYADYLPHWSRRFGERLHIVFFDAWRDDPASASHELAQWLEIDPDPLLDRSQVAANQTRQYRLAALQRLALRINVRFEEQLRRTPRMQQLLKAGYGRLNLREPDPVTTPELSSRVRELYADSLARLTEQLDDLGVTNLPDWLAVTARSA